MSFIIGKRRGRLLAACLAGGVWLGMQGTVDAQARPWTPETSVAVRYYSSRPGSFDDPSFLWSADRRQVAVTSWRGDLATDSNIMRIEVFRADDVTRALGTGEHVIPAAVAEIRTASNHEGVKALEWAREGNALLFLGAQGEEPPQVWKLDVLSNSLRALTNAPLGVGAFAVRGDTLVYLSRTAMLQNPWDAAYPGIYDPPASISRQGWWAAFASGEARWAMFLVQEGQPPRRVGDERVVLGGYWFNGHTVADLWISPDGRWVLARQAVSPASATAAWRPPSGRSHSTAPEEYTLTDLQSGQERTLFRAPTGRSVGENSPTVAAWAPDGTRLVVTNTVVAGIDDGGKALAIVEYDLGRQRAIVIEEGQPPEPRGYFHQIRWEGDRLIALSQSGTTRSYRHRRGRWQLAETRPAEEGPGLPFALALEQSRNMPPRLVATAQGRSLYLSEPDPAVSDVTLAQVEPFVWLDPQGQQWTGALSLPPGYGAGGEPLPLVIQPYYPVKDRFLPDGVISTALARQTLNARGFAVLEMYLRPDDSAVGPGEGDWVAREIDNFVQSVDAAVDGLAADNLVDPDRVGIVSYSRGAFVIKHAVSSPGRTRFAAAHAADGWGASYTGYLSAWRTPGWHGEWLSLYGGSPWENPDGWLAREPSLNAHRIETPLLISEHAGIQDADLYAAIRLQGRAAEHLLLPYALHNARRPSERVASMEATVDWMSFWLQGREDPDPDKSERYRRWRELRESHCDSVQDRHPACH